jgi:hypothetical protein
MAIVRCLACGKPTISVKPPGYSDKPHLPVGHPRSGLICGKPFCGGTGLVWLKKDEEKEYAKGERIFGIHTQTAKVMVQ